MTAELRTLMEGRQREHERLKLDVPYVFTRTKLVKQADGEWKPRAGNRIIRLEKAWRAACRAAGMPGRIFHDLRRSAVTGFRRSGLSESTAMQLSGHLTASVFRRYDIHDDSDLEAAAAQLDAVAARPKRSKPGRVVKFKRTA
jgi:integrase